MFLQTLENKLILSCDGWKTLKIKIPYDSDILKNVLLLLFTPLVYQRNKEIPVSKITELTPLQH